MKKIFVLLVFLSVIMQTANAQFVVNSKFKPLSYDELILYAQAKAARDAYNEQLFDEYQDKAYASLNRGDKHGFVTYSNYALQTGWYNAKLYYDRGRVFQSLGDFRSAKKEYKKAKRKGYYLAESALKELKAIRKKK